MVVEGLCSQIVSSLDPKVVFINAEATIGIRSRGLRKPFRLTFFGNTFARDFPIQERIGSCVKDEKRA